ncbi:TAXI family TRAP transporter solute-binding subunit [Desulfogranum mediterraneum]|uniref:TAXI family TRAP transporter solute-binding subunit n=1 Tax=Desulfogranum mediterraneum TaxID=160661 RepID=UPI0006844919|nr:TAXI family TRAP transporter solute-binding subunit [Desulfogranum mediterraneum]
MKTFIVLTLCCMGLLSGMAKGVNAEEMRLLTVATGGLSGVYYPIGSAIASLLSDNFKISTSVQSTEGSVENIQLLNSNRAELAIVTADTASQAFNGNGAFSRKKPMKSLRGLASLYPNYVQVVTTAGSGIKSLEDLAGKRVGVGAHHSGVELNAQLILEASGLSYDTFQQVYLSLGEAIDQLEQGTLDAAFVTSGLPNRAITDLSLQRKVVLLPINEKALASLTKKYPAFTPGKIPGGTYSQMQDVPTAVTSNILVAKDSMSDEIVYRITKSIFEHLDIFYSTHKAARKITLDSVAQGMPIPFHPGAEKYFREVGALQ